HPDQDVARVDLALDGLPLAVLDLGVLLGRHLDLEDVLLHVEVVDPGLEVGLDLVLVAGVRVHHVPVARLLAELLPHLLQRVYLGRRLLGNRRRGSPDGTGRHAVRWLSVRWWHVVRWHVVRWHVVRWLSARSWYIRGGRRARLRDVGLRRLRRRGRH